MTKVKQLLIPVKMRLFNADKIVLSRGVVLADVTFGIIDSPEEIKEMQREDKLRKQKLRNEQKLKDDRVNMVNQATISPPASATNGATATGISWIDYELWKKRS